MRKEAKRKTGDNSECQLQKPPPNQRGDGKCATRVPGVKSHSWSWSHNSLSSEHWAIAWAVEASRHLAWSTEMCASSFLSPSSLPLRSPIGQTLLNTGGYRSLRKIACRVSLLSHTAEQGNDKKWILRQIGLRQAQMASKPSRSQGSWSSGTVPDYLFMLSLLVHRWY